MKNKSFDIITKASFKSNSLLTVMFGFFVAVSFALILLAVGLIVPLGQNIEEKINNHILNREIIAEISEFVSEEECRQRLDKIKSLEHVTDVYEIPMELSVTDKSGLVSGDYTLSYIHRGFTPKIVSGRSFDESETNVVIIPASFRDYDAAKGVLTEVDGKKLVGNTLRLSDITGVIREFKIVGCYDTTDPIFSGKEFLTPTAPLLKYKEYILNNMSQSLYSQGSSYTVLTDSPKNTEAVLKSVEKITNCYRQKMTVDSETYNIAFVILLISTVFFIILTVFGFYLFLKNNINMRTKELALYRAIGFSSRNLYSIIFYGHFLPVLASASLGIILYLSIGGLAVNPYLESFLGETYMEMTLSADPLIIGAVFVGYTLITLWASKTAVKRSEKIDLTVLLRN